MYHIYRMDIQDRGAKICWFLTEIGVPFSMAFMDHHKFHFDPEFLKKHPLGLVPVLHDVALDFYMFESSAILLYLAKKHPSEMVGNWSGTEFAKVMQWFAYNNCTLEPIYEQYFSLKNKTNDPRAAVILASIANILAPIETQLQSTLYIAGQEFSLADLALSQTLYWLTRLPLVDNFPMIKPYLRRITQRPAAIHTGLFPRKNF